MLEVLGNEVDDLVGVDLSGCIVELQREIDRLSARQAKYLAEWNDSGDWASDGSRSPAHRLSRETGLSVGDAKALITRGRRLTTMPLTMSSFLSGSLSSSRVDLLIRANQPSLSSLFSRDEALLVESAQLPLFGDAHRAIRYWIQCAQDETGSNDSDKLVNSRSVYCSKTFEGTVDLKGFLDPIGGEVFLNELNRLERELFESDWAQAKELLGDKEVTIGSLVRSNTQRRADALVEMAKRSAESRASSSSKPLFSVLMDYSSFERVCELASGTIISPKLLVPYLSKSDIERVVFDSSSRVIDVSHRRSFSGALRRAIELRDRHCKASSGCDEQVANCQVDHITPWAKGGPTTQENGQLLCAKHNLTKGVGPP